MLTLFQLWSENELSLLKLPDQTWSDTFNAAKTMFSSSHVQAIKNMQLLHASRDAKFDCSAKRRCRLAELNSQARQLGVTLDEDEYEPIWENAMTLDISDEGGGEHDQSLAVAEITKSANAAGFYQSTSTSVSEYMNRFKNRSLLGDEGDIEFAEQANNYIMREKELAQQKRLALSAKRREQHDQRYRTDTSVACPFHHPF
jgi:hypothetical protein